MAATIKGITIEIGGNTTKLVDALKDVNKEIKGNQLDLKELDKLLKLDPGNTELLVQKQKALTSAIDATKSKLEQEKTALEQLKNAPQTERTIQQQEALTREIVKTEQSLKSLQDEYKNFGSVAAQQLQAAGSKIQEFGGKISGMGSALAPVSTALTGVGTAAVMVGMDFDAQMSKVKAISGATSEDFDKLRDKAREMGANTKFSATEAAQALEYMAMAGWKPAEMLDGLEGIMNLAAASGEELGTTSDIVTDALTAFGLKASDSGHFADVLATASSNANTNVSMLGESFKYAAPVVGALGGTAEDASIALGLMANAGIKSSEAGTSLRTGLTNLVKPSKQMAEAMEAYGIEIQKNADGSVNLRETMIHLRTQMGQLSETEQASAAAAIFGKNAMAGWLAIINASDQDFNKLTTAIDTCDGKSKEMAETMQDNLQGDLTKLNSALQELAIQISDALMPTFRSIVDHVKSWVEWLQGLDDGTKTTIVVIGTFVAALAPILIVIGQLVISVGAITKAIGAFSGFMSATAIPAIGGFLTAWWPVIAIIAGVVAAIAGLILIFKNWGEICEWFGELWDSIWGVIKDSFTGIFMFISDTIGLIASVITNVFTGIKDFFVSIWDNVSDTCSSAWDKISSGIGETMTLIGGVISKAWTGIKENLAPILAKISDGIKDHWTTAKNIVSDAVEATRSFVSEKWDAISSYVSGVCETVTETIGEKWESAKERVSTTVESLKTAVGEKWDAMKERVLPIMQTIGDGILEKWEAVKERTASIYDNIASYASSAWDNIKESVSSKITGMWESVKSKFTGIWETIKGIVQRIRDCFSFEWKLPKIKLPHFKITGSFSLSPPSVPHLSIEWYKKAMDDAYILNNPTIFGAAGGKLLGGGEAGSEAVVGTDKLGSMIREAVASVIGNGGTTVIPVYIGQERIEEIVVRANQSINYRSGGR